MQKKVCSDVSDKHAASIFRVNIWFRWMLK